MSVILQFSQSSSAQIPYTMNKSLHRNTRNFGNDIKNNLTQNDAQTKLSLVTRSRKRVAPLFQQSTSSSRPQMEYFDEILKYTFTSLSYPQFLKGHQKVKRDVQSLLNEVTSLDKSNSIWYQKFMDNKISTNKYFCAEQITLQKRCSLIDWIITVHKKYKLRQQTLHLTIRLIDDYCTKNNLPLSKYQLLGISALFMSAKYQEIELPRFKDYFRLVEGQFGKEDIIKMQGDILVKSQFQISRKITALWYLQTFAQIDILFSGQNTNRCFKKNKKQEADKQNINSLFLKNQDQDDYDTKFEKFLSYSRYILNLILMDYKIISKFKQDIIAISTLIFVSMKKGFDEADGKGLMKHFAQKKERLIEQNESAEEIMRTIKKCMQKIQKLHSGRFENRFFSINQKFNIDIRQ